MLIFNPTKKEVEFRYGGVPYTFKPKESKDLPEHIVNHATERVNTPLVVQTPMHDSQVEMSDVNYETMPWKKLVQMASARGVFKMGTKRPELEKVMEDYDQQKTGIIQKPTN